MNIPRLIKEHHQAMKDKGFHDCPECKGKGSYWPEGTREINKFGGTPPPKCKDCEGSGINTNKNIGEMLMLIVSELGEALEAHRCGRFAELDKYEKSVLPTAYRAYMYGSFEEEIADVFLRLFDLCGYLKWTVEPFGGKELSKKRFENIGSFFMVITGKLHYAYEQIVYLRDFEETNPIGSLEQILGFLLTFCDHHSIPIEKHIIAKMAYNKTRPYNHGKEY
jgi:NTP pyrophosphatase (non-canonical NTP hydrolase)